MPNFLLVVACASTTFAIAAFVARAAPTTAPTTQPVSPALSYTMPRLDGTPQPLSAYAGKVVLVVNTASKCGFTKQYAGLESLNKRYAEKGLAVLGFPSDDFRNQEFGSDAEIAAFCQDKFGVSFPMFSKVDVLGDAQVPLFKLLTSTAPETGDIKWNFEKFLIARDGRVVARFRSKVAPESDEVIRAIEAELAK